MRLITPIHRPLAVAFTALLLTCAHMSLAVRTADAATVRLPRSICVRVRGDTPAQLTTEARRLARDPKTLFAACEAQLAAGARQQAQQGAEHAAGVAATSTKDAAESSLSTKWKQATAKAKAWRPLDGSGRRYLALVIGALWLWFAHAPRVRRLRRRIF